MIPRLLLLSAVSIINAACTGPFQNRTLPDGNGGEKSYFFAYGEFCGGGWPPIANNTERTDQLIAMWPPRDDLDAICYAHDYCYAVTQADDRVCDSAFHNMIIESQVEFEKRGCWNVTTDIAIAFFYKNWGTGNSPSETASVRAAGAIVGWPSCAFWTALKIPAKPFLSYPEEGDCNAGEDADPELIIEEFSSRYRQSSLNTSKKEIVIPVGSSD